METTAAVMFVLLAILFAGIGGAKIARAPFMRANAAHLGYSLRAYQAIGALEVAGAGGLIIGLFWPPIGIAAAIGLVALMVGAVLAIRRADDGPKELAPALWVGLIAALAAVFGVIGAVAG